MKKIFISHSSKDTDVIDNFVQKILRLGLNIQADQIFCTSIEGLGIRTGKDFLEVIKNNISNADLVIVMISENYKKSEICLNEMGASWVLSKEVIPILIPPLSFQEVGLLQITNNVIKINTPSGLDNIIHTIEHILNLTNKIDIRNLNKHRDDFLKIFSIQKEINTNTKNEIQLIKKQFSIGDTNTANLIWHLGNFEKEYRSQNTLIKKNWLDRKSD